MFTIGNVRMIGRFWAVECLTVDGAAVWTVLAFDARIAVENAHTLAVESQEV
jgi:hypothetical protein